jgi:hypothetical protein
MRILPGGSPRRLTVTICALLIIIPASPLLFGQAVSIPQAQGHSRKAQGASAGYPARNSLAAGKGSLGGASRLAVPGGSVPRGTFTNPKPGAFGGGGAARARQNSARGSASMGIKRGRNKL